MAARKKKIRHDEETRAKIQATQLIHRLHSCVMGEVELSSQQVSAASTLLNKVLPNLQAVDMAVEKDNTEWLVADRPMPRQAYENQFAKRTVEPAGGASNAPRSLPN